MLMPWISGAPLYFLRPWWLLGLLVLPAWWWWQRRHRQQDNVWRSVVDPHLLPYLLANTSAQARRAWASVLGGVGLALVVVALAGPSLHQSKQPLWGTQAPLVIAVDLSSASLTQDLQPNRLAQMRAKLALLLRQRAGGQVALVAFADDAYTVAPLTSDAANVALFLDALTPEVMPMDAHRVGRAIAWSQSLLQQSGYRHGDILLLTDHADASDAAAATAAAGAGYKVSVLGIGTALGGVYQAGNGLQRANLDAPSLQRLARLGGGRYAALGNGDADVRALGLLTPAAERAVVQEKTVQRRADDGYWLLPLVLLLCLPLFRRGGALACLLVCGLWVSMLSPPAQAQVSATSEVKGTLWQRADQAAYARMQAGIAAYNKQQYAQAIKTLTPLHGADAQYNLGNALARTGQWDAAIAAYARALHQQPGMRDAQFNKQLVEQAKRQQPPQPKPQQDSKQDSKQGSKQDSKQDSNQNSKQNSKQNSPNNPQQDSQKNTQQGTGKPSQGQPPPSAPQPQPQPQPPQQQQPPSERNQQQADAAQRQRMQAALQQQQAAKPPAARSAAPAETPAQREQRLANQAWLQRVPDDPGALLRARFQLEAQRRREQGP